MAETAKQLGPRSGSDAVRRLLARPIRTHGARTPLPPASDRLPEPAGRPTAEPALPIEATAAPDPADTERLRTELLLLKAVLRAERRENESLRACIGFEEDGAGLTPEARAMRDRWAALVDRLLYAPA